MNSVRMTDSILTGVLLSFAVLAMAGLRLHGQSGRTETLEFEHAGLTRASIVHVPRGYDGKSPVPLVLSFHGRHGQGKNQADLSHFHQVADRHGFLVVYPDGVGKSWNALHGTGEAEARKVDDVGFVTALLAKLSDRFAIDPDRIYASGMSNGGFFAHRLGCELSERFAAIASVAGQMAPALEKVCQPKEPPAVLTIHGTRDRIVPYAGGKTEGGGSLLSAEKTIDVWRRLNGCSDTAVETLRKGQVTCRAFQGCRAPVTLCSVQGAGHTWPGGDQYAPRLLVGATNRDIDASELIWEFFAANPKRRGAAAPAPEPEPAPSKGRPRPRRR